MKSTEISNDVIFEKMSPGHAREVMEIFNYYITNSFSAYPDSPLPVEFFGKLLEMIHGYPAYVIKKGEEIAGFCFIRPYSPFPTFKHTAEITYFIAPDFRGAGIGRQALAKLEKEAIEMGVMNILASISSENAESIAFHSRNGFSECGRFAKAGNKFGKFFDVVWMQKKLQ